MSWSRLAAVGIAIGLCLACGGRKMTLELNASVMYEKPKIARVAYTVADGRRQGGAVQVNVRLEGDAGLDGSFDISPGIADARPLVEVSAGRYEGTFAFPKDVVGGPYTIIGRLRHAEAGEVTQRDPVPLTISLYR